MPAYEYKCKNKKCKTKVFSTFEPMVMDHVGHCPDCKTEGKRVFSLAGFVIDFRPGWDPGLGQFMNTARQRDTYVDKHELRRVKD